MICPLLCTSLILSSTGFPWALLLLLQLYAYCSSNRWSHFLCLDHHIFTKTGTLPLHCTTVKSPLKCLFLREVFLFSVPLAYFIFLMDLLLYFPLVIWNCIILLLFVCPNRMKTSQKFELLSVLLTSLCPGLGWVHEVTE